MPTVYVKWYGKVLEGELLDGEYLGMKQVRVPLDGHHPIALFMPWSVYDSPEKVAADSPLNSPNTPRSFPELPAKEQIPAMSDVLPADDREMIEAFKRDNWDQERNHLRIDKLDEFYQLWRMAMRPFGFVDEAEATVTLPSHKEKPVSAEAVQESCTPKKPQSHKPAAITKGYSEITNPYPAITQPYSGKSQEPTKKILRSTGVQQFKDSTQLALFE